MRSTKMLVENKVSQPKNLRNSALSVSVCMYTQLGTCHGGSR